MSAITVVLLVALAAAVYVAHRRRLWSNSPVGTRLAIVTFAVVVGGLMSAGEVISRRLKEPDDFFALYGMLCTLVVVAVQGLMLAALSAESPTSRGLGWIASILLVTGLGAWVSLTMSEASDTSRGMVFASFLFGGLITVLADAMNGAPADAASPTNPRTR